MSSSDRKKNASDDSAQVSEHPSSAGNSAVTRKRNSFYSNFRGLGGSFFLFHAVQDLAARIADQTELNEKAVDERYRQALQIFDGFADTKKQTTMDPLTATHLLDDRYVQKGKLTKGEKNLRFWIGAKRREHAIHAGVKLLTMVFATFEGGPPGFGSVQADACYSCLQLRLNELELPVEQRQDLVVFPEGSEWEPIRKSFYAYTMYAIDNEVKLIEQILPKPKCQCCSDDARHGETAQLIKNIRSKLIAQDSVKARLKLKKGIYEALYIARLVVEDKEKSLAIKDEAAKEAREKIDKLMEQFIDALKAGRNGRSRKLECLQIPTASLCHTPVSRRHVPALEKPFSPSHILS